MLAVGAAVLVSIGSGATPASASAIYNDSESGKPNPVHIYFSCGTFCSNHFKVVVGGSASRPGKSGTFVDDEQADASDWTGQGDNTCMFDQHSLEDHGWASLEYQSGEYAWAIYGSDQNSVSGSPFALHFKSCGSPGPPVPPPTPGGNN